MKYKFYTTSEKTWQAMHSAILSAQKSIYLESYILFEDSQTHHFFKTLKDKAQSGVKVKIVADRVGSFWINSVSLAEYAKAGIEVLFFRRLFNRNHRKVLIIDEKIAFIGGVNIHGKYAKWIDLHISLSDEFFIKKILGSFARVYQLAGGIDPEVAGYLKKRRIDEPRRTLYQAKIFFIEHWPFRRRAFLKKYYERKIASARESIVIVTPYFIPHRWLISALDQAIKRGVSVEVLMPKNTDVALLNAANWIFAEELSDRIKFRFLPEMIHAKVLLIDEIEGMVGSNNIDAQSFDFNLETAVIFQEKDMIGDLKEILNQWRTSATPYDKLPRWWPWYYRPLKFFIKLIQPEL